MNAVDRIAREALARLRAGRLVAVAGILTLAAAALFGADRFFGRHEACVEEVRDTLLQQPIDAEQRSIVQLQAAFAERVQECLDR